MQPNPNAQRPLCLGLSREWGPMDQTIDLLAETGWNGWFAVWRPGEDLRPVAARGAELGLAVQSVHAPWGKAADLWGADEAKGEAAVEELRAQTASVLMLNRYAGYFAESWTEQNGCPALTFQDALSVLSEGGALSP